MALTPTHKAVFSVALPLPAPAAASADYAIDPGTAVAGTDYVDTSGTLNWATGEQFKTIEVLTRNPLAGAAAEFFLEFSNPVNCALPTARQASGSITGQPLPPPLTSEIYFYPATKVDNGDGTFSLSGDVEMWPEQPAEVSVDWSTADDTAVAGEDYTTSSGTLTFAPGETVKPVVVPIRAEVLEGEEKFRVNFSNVQGMATLWEAYVDFVIPALPPPFFSDSLSGEGTIVGHIPEINNIPWSELSYTGTNVPQLTSGMLTFSDTGQSTKGAKVGCSNMSGVYGVVADILTAGDTGDFTMGVSNSPMSGQSYSGSQVRLNFDSTGDDTVTIISTYGASTPVALPAGWRALPTKRFEMRITTNDTTVGAYLNGSLLAEYDMENPIGAPIAFELFISTFEAYELTLDRLQIIPNGVPAPESTPMLHTRDDFDAASPTPVLGQVPNITEDNAAWRDGSEGPDGGFFRQNGTGYAEVVEGTDPSSYSKMAYAFLDLPAGDSFKLDFTLRSVAGGVLATTDADGAGFGKVLGIELRCTDSGDNVVARLDSYSAGGGVWSAMTHSNMGNSPGHEFTGGLPGAAGAPVKFTIEWGNATLTMKVNDTVVDTMSTDDGGGNPGNPAGAGYLYIEIAKGNYLEYVDVLQDIPVVVPPGPPIELYSANFNGASGTSLDGTAPEVAPVGSTAVWSTDAARLNGAGGMFLRYSGQGMLVNLMGDLRKGIYIEYQVTASPVYNSDFTHYLRWTDGPAAISLGSYSFAAGVLQFARASSDLGGSTEDLDVLPAARTFVVRVELDPALNQTRTYIDGQLAKTQTFVHAMGDLTDVGATLTLEVSGEPTPNPAVDANRTFWDYLVMGQLSS